MAVDSKHPDYEKYIDRWLRCRHTAEGSDAVKEQGIRYLPKLGGQKDDDYQSYKLRALWYGATSRTINGLRGAVFRKDPIVTFPEAKKDLLDSVTNDNLDLISLASEVTTEQLTEGRIGLLVDLPEGESTGEKMPYISRYAAESILNWRTENVKGKEVLTMVVLCETVEKEQEDGYSLKEEKQYRVLRLIDGVYIQEIYGEKGKEKEFQPKRFGKAIDFIPFRFINVTSLTAKPEKPPLMDVVDVNLSHYRSSADLEHGAHFTALPVPWFAGFPVKSQLPIGSGIAYVTEEVQAKAGMLEFTGQGLNALRDIKQDKENLMAVLGARLLEAQKKGVEASETVRLRSSGESGVLAAMVKTSSRGVTDALGWFSWMAGITNDPIADKAIISLEMNKDFLDQRLGPRDIAELLKALQAGAISQETWLYNLERGEILPPETSIEDERDLIDVQSGASDEDFNNASQNLQ